MKLSSEEGLILFVFSRRMRPNEDVCRAILREIKSGAKARQRLSPAKREFQPLCKTGEMHQEERAK
jgi:hypothetical protein